MKKIHLIFGLAGFFGWAQVMVSQGQEPTRAEITLTVPETAAVGKPIGIQVHTAGNATALKLKVIPFLEVTKKAKAAGVAVADKVMLDKGKAVIAITVKAPGEYHLLIENGMEATQVAIIAEGPDVWLAEGTVGALLQARLLKTYQNAAKLKGKALDNDFQTAYRALLEARAKAAANESSKATTRSAKALAAGTINANDTLFFKAKWQGPKPSDPKDPATPADLTIFESFPVDGVKVIIRNSANNALVTETYMVNGVCSFVAPVNGFVPRINLVSSFPGITAAGAINIAGGGIGAFVVEDGAGTTYSYQIPTPLDFVGKTEATAVDFVFNRSVARGGDNIAQMFATFHGVADMVRELKRTIGQDKAKNFKVHFPQAGTTSFFGGDKKLHITGVRSYVWDVIGHEFGHMVQDDTSSINAQGGKHDGSNQYDLATNATTKNNKLLSNRLALNEGYGTWLGVAFTERSSRYAGQLKWVGDLLYRDWVNLENNSPKFTFGAAAYKGEDTELAIQALLWDLHDANADSYAAAGLRDQTALGLKFLFEKFDGKSMDSIFDVWRQVFVPSANMANFTKKSGVDGVALKRALTAASTFAEFGAAPHLQSPVAGVKIDLSAKKGPKIRWKQYATGNAAMDLNRFKIIVYSSDLTETLWTSPNFSAGSAPLASLGGRTYEYELKKADLTALKTATKDRTDASVVMAILGTANLAPATGSYLSNGVELLLQDFNRAMVAVVDSSGSNTSTDPTNQRVVASKESLKRLVSLADAAADKKKVPDIAAAVDFDSRVKVLSNFADPDAVIPTLDAIDSSGGTSIDGGLNAATSLLDNVTAVPGIAGIFTDRAAILLFTDGQNNSGDGPVIAAILAAAAKGYRVHYGFLSPLVSPSARSALVTSKTAEPTSGPGDSYPPAKRSNRSLAAVGPSTIEQAILFSGGVFAQIGDAQSQIAFIEQVFSRGLTNVDGGNSSGGLIVGQANTADQLTPEADIKSYRFTGQKNENVTVRVETVNFQPNVTVFDRSGNIVGIAIAQPGASSVNLVLPPLPYSGEYSARVYAEDGRTGIFNIFIDVQNVIAELPVIESQSDLVFKRQTGFFQQTVTVSNGTAFDIAGFEIEVSGLPKGASVKNSAADDDIVTYGGTLPAGETVELIIEYFNPARVAFVPSLSLTSDQAEPPPTFSKGALADEFVAEDGSIIVEFPSKPGSIYYVQYSDDGGQNWETTLPAIHARGTRVQWVDSGPPKTSVHPSQAPNRAYRYVKQLAN